MFIFIPKSHTIYYSFSKLLNQAMNRCELAMIVNIAVLLGKMSGPL